MGPNVFFWLLYSTISLLSPHRFHCAGGCWGWTQDCWLRLATLALANKRQPTKSYDSHPPKITFWAYFYLFVSRTINNRCLHNIGGALVHFSRLHVKKFRDVHFFLHCNYSLTIRKNIPKIRHLITSHNVHHHCVIFLFAVRWIFRVWRPGACQINKYRNRQYHCKDDFCFYI